MGNYNRPMDYQDKRAARYHFLRLRSKLPPAEVSRKSRIITEKVLRLDKVKRAKKIASYIAINNEVDTRLIIDKLIRDGSVICFPTYFASRKNYFFSQFSNWDEMIGGPYGILQPKDNVPIDPATVGVAILPGVAYSHQGLRLGYGKGVFDRLLAKSAAFKIGLAYDFQVVEDLSKDEHDIVVDLVVTEKKVYRT